MSLLTECCASALDLPLTEYKARVDPVIFSLLKEWVPINDDLSQRAIEVGMRAIDTVGDADAMRHRRWRVRDWTLRTFAVAWFRGAGLNEEAEELRGTVRLIDEFAAASAKGLVQKVCTKADAAWQLAQMRDPEDAWLMAQRASSVKALDVLGNAVWTSGWSSEHGSWARMTTFLAAAIEKLMALTAWSAIRAKADAMSAGDFVLAMAQEVPLAAQEAVVSVVNDLSESALGLLGTLIEMR